MTLKEKREKAYSRMEEILRVAKEENGGILTAEQRKEFDALEREYDEATLSGRKTHPDSGSPLDGNVKKLHAGSGRKYREMFGLQNLSNDGFDSAADFYDMVHFNPSALAAREGTLVDGGLMVPEQFSAEMLDASLESEIVRPRASVYPMTSNTRKIAGFENNTRTSTLFGAFTAKWKQEGGEADEQSPKVRQITLDAHKLFLYTESSSELLEDAGSFGAMLGQAMTDATGYFLDDAFLWGSGAGQPLGVFNAPCLVTVAKETGQAADTLVYENLTRMFARMHPAGLSRAVWVINSTAIPQLLQLTITVGTGGTHVPVMTRGPEGFEILGRPVIFSEKMKTLGDLGDVLFADFQMYAIGMRKEVAVEQSQHYKFKTDEISYRAILRADGQPKWDKVLTPKNGDTQSPFVTLAARA